MHHVEGALDGDGWLTPAAIEQRNSGGDAMFVRTQGIDERLDGFCGVLARQRLDALWASGWIAGVACLKPGLGCPALNVTCVNLALL